MAPFGENFRGKQMHTICPLCHTHLDNQPMALQCEEIKKELQIKIKIEDIFKDNIHLHVAQELNEVMKIRQKLAENQTNPSAPNCSAAKITI